MKTITLTLILLLTFLLSCERMHEVNNNNNYSKQEIKNKKVSDLKIYEGLNFEITMYHKNKMKTWTRSIYITKIPGGLLYELNGNNPVFVPDKFVEGTQSEKSKNIFD